MRFRITPDGKRRRVGSATIVRSMGESGSAYTTAPASTASAFVGAAQITALLLGSAAGTSAYAGIAAPTATAEMHATTTSTYAGTAVAVGAAEIRATATSISGGAAWVSVISSPSYVVAHSAYSGTAKPTAIAYVHAAAATSFGGSAAGYVQRYATAITHTAYSGGASLHTTYSLHASGASQVAGFASPVAIAIGHAQATSAYVGSARIIRKAFLSAHSLSGFGGTARIRLNKGSAFRKLFIDVFNARQTLENAISAHNRSLAKDAQLQSVANADAIVETNASVTRVDGRVTAEANRTTLLTAEVAGKASSQALNALSTQVTQQGDQITAQGSLIQSVQTDLNGKASSQTLSNLSTQVTQQGDQITAQGSLIQSVQTDLNGKASSQALNNLSTQVTQQGDQITAQGSLIQGVQTDLNDKASSSALSSLQTQVTQQGDDITANALQLTQVNTELAGKASSSALNSLTTQVSDHDGQLTAQAGQISTINASLGDKADASAVTYLNAVVGDHEGRISANTQTGTMIAAALGDKADSSALTTLQTQVTQQGTDINANSSAITAVSAEVAGKASASVVQEMRAYVAQGGNLIKNSTFEPGIEGWTGSPNRNLAAPNYKPPLVNTIGFTVGGVRDSSYIVDSFSSPAPCEAGAYYAVSAQLAAHSCAARVHVIFMDAAGNWLSSPYVGDNNGALGGNVLSGWYRAQGVFQAPANTTQVALLFRLNGNGGSNPYAWMCQPQIAKVSPGTTTAPPYSPGGVEMHASATMFAKAGNSLVGYKIGTDGVTSDFEFYADNFRLVTGDGYGLALDKTKMDRRFTGAAIYEGNAFGSDNLAFWIGPSNISKSGATKANAAFWVDFTGLHGGGSAIGGATVYFNQATAEDNAISATTAVFARNPNKVREITATLRLFANSTKFSDDGNSTIDFITPYVIEVSRDGGAWTQLGGVNTCTGTLTRENSEPSVTYYSATAQGLTTFYDDGGGTNVQYRARETGNMPTVGTDIVPSRTITIKVTEI